MSPSPDPSPSSGIEIIAHRGYSARAPENTIAAMERAIGAGADALEFDLQTAVDGTPYLFHDDMLGRTTDGHGAFSQCPPDVLTSLDAGSWFSPDFAGERVPSLRATLDRVSGRIPRVYPEIKRVMDPIDVDRMVAAVEESGWTRGAFFISMDWEALERVRAVTAEVGIGYIVERRGRTEDGLRRAAHDPRALIDFDARILLADSALGRTVAETGVDVAVWTVDDPDEASHLFEMGVRRFTTNEVETMLEWRRTV